MKMCATRVYSLFASLGIAAGLFSGRSTEGAPEEQAKLESHFAQLGTNRIHYSTQGPGTNAIVFIHGWACNAGFWREQVPAFAEKARLVLIDLPGHGESDKPETDYTLDY